MKNRSVYKTAGISLGATLIFCLVLYNISDNYVYDFLALLLAAFSGTYLLPALMQPGWKTVLSEIIVFIVILAAAMAGIYISFIVTGVGYLLMNLWHLYHNFRSSGLEIPRRVKTGLLTVNSVLTVYIIFILIL